MNILANAVKINNHQGGWVRIEGQTDGSSGVYRLSVSDTGIGIADLDLDRLFRPFERLSAADSDVEGTGLGLALSKRLVTEMGGQVGVSSCVGEGGMRSASNSRSRKLPPNPPPKSSLRSTTPWRRQRAHGRSTWRTTSRTCG